MASRLTALVLALCGALVMSGCGALAPTDPYGADGGLSLAVVQGRDDRGARIVAIEVTNNRSDAISITRAQLDGAQLAAPAVWEKGTSLRAGLTVDLLVQLGDPACPLAPDITPRVTVSFTTASGVERTVSAEPSQPSGVLTRIASEDCLIEAINTQASITVKSVEYVAGAHLPAVLVVGIQPRDVDGSATIVAVAATVLLALVDPNGNYSQRYTLNRVLQRGGDSSDLHISLVPNRCDVHAVAEDKRGTFIPLETTTDSGLEGTYFVAMPDEQKGQLYAFYSDYCGVG